MAKDGLDLKITVIGRIEKYAEGVDPSTEAPYEVIEGPITLSGQDAVNFMRDNNLQISKGE